MFGLSGLGVYMPRIWGMNGGLGYGGPLGGAYSYFNRVSSNYYQTLTGGPFRFFNSFWSMSRDLDAMMWAMWPGARRSERSYNRPSRSEGGSNTPRYASSGGPNASPSAPAPDAGLSQGPQTEPGQVPPNAQKPAADGTDNTNANKAASEKMAIDTMIDLKMTQPEIDESIAYLKKKDPNRWASWFDTPGQIAISQPDLKNRGLVAVGMTYYLMHRFTAPNISDQNNLEKAFRNVQIYIHNGANTILKLMNHIEKIKPETVSPAPPAPKPGAPVAKKKAAPAKAKASPGGPKPLAAPPSPTQVPTTNTKAAFAGKGFSIAEAGLILEKFKKKEDQEAILAAGDRRAMVTEIGKRYFKAHMGKEAGFAVFVQGGNAPLAGMFQEIDALPRPSK